jgi:rubrerythrin
MAMASPSKKQDVAILNYALTLEYLEAAFYNEAVAKGSLNAEVKTAAKTVAGHENAHVAFLKKALGSAAVKKPKFDFKGTTADQKKFMATAQVLEDTGVAAYQGQAPNIKTGAVLAAAGSILAVEARHAAWARYLAGKTPAPDAFEMPKDMQAILDAVKGTGFLKG